MWPCSWVGRTQSDALSDEEPEEVPNVFCNVYDIVPLFNRSAQCIIPRWSIYHTGVEVYGLEFSFGGHSGSSTGVSCAKPGSVKGATFKKKVPIGKTNLDPLELREAVAELSKQWPGNSYDPFTRNCNVFADFLCRELTGRGAPSYINSFATSNLLKGLYDHVLTPMGNYLQLGLVTCGDEEDDVRPCAQERLEVKGARGMDQVLVEAATVQKAKATAMFKEGRHLEAKASYLKALSYLDNMKQGDEQASSPTDDGVDVKEEQQKELRAQVATVRVALLLNVAACSLKLEANDDVLRCCNEVLEMEPMNEKALYRRGVANVNLGELADASADFRQVLRLTDKSDSATIRALRRELDRIKEKLGEDKRMAQRMLGQASTSSPSTEDTGMEPDESPSPTHGQQQAMLPPL